MSKWEYNIIVLKYEDLNDASDILNVQGKNGWEVYHVYDSVDHSNTYLGPDAHGNITLSMPDNYKNFLLKRVKK